MIRDRNEGIDSATPLGAGESPLPFEEIRDWMTLYLSLRTGVDSSAIQTAERFQRLGLDSMGATAMLVELGLKLGRPLSPTLVWEFPTPDSLARHLVSAGAITPAALLVAAAKPVDEEPIAVIGMACRFPNAPSLAAFWTLLCAGGDAITEVPQERWNISTFYNPDPSIPGKMSTQWGGFLSGVDGFDPSFFGISPREAVQIDPQQRLALELAWEALEDGQIAPASLRDSRTGVFFGAMWMDYMRLLAGSPEIIAQHTATGQDLSIIPARISYVLGLSGPSIVVNTACSSSLVAVHLACQSLLRGESRICLSGGVNLLLSPESTIAMTKFGAMAPDGRCKAFDARANGYVRGEGGGVIVLKRLSDAIADGDRIYCLIRGSAVNNDGFSNGLTAPSPRAQEAVLREAYSAAGVDPATVDYVEAHGTGTMLGDPIEAGALGAVLGRGRTPQRALRIGSVKTNIGHLEAAAGIAGLIKVALSMHHRALPKSLHFTRPNPHIPFDALRLRVQTEHATWQGENGHLLAGVSSFGFGGTNCHVVLEAPIHEEPRTFILSAQSEEGLRAAAQQYVRTITGTESPSLDMLCSDAAAQRPEKFRLAAVVHSPDELLQKLCAFEKDTAASGLWTAAQPGTPPRVAMLFTGQGAQYVGMGRQLYQTQPAFAAVVDRCAEELLSELPRPLLDVMWAAPGTSDAALLHRTAYTQPALFTIEYALAELWRSFGVEPGLLIGHSIGELVAACVSGVLSLPDALRLVAARGRLMDSLPPGGAMVALAASEADVAPRLSPWSDRVALAAVNGPTDVVISGDDAIVTAIAESFAADGVRTQKLKVSHAFHSPLMAPIRDEFRRVASSLSYGLPRIPLVTNLDGRLAGSSIADAEHWLRHVEAPVRFADGLRTLVAEQVDVLLEVGPHPVLIELAGKVPQLHASHRLRSLERTTADSEAICEALGRLFVAGVPISSAVTMGSNAEQVPALVVLSAQGEPALNEQAALLGAHLDAHPAQSLTDVAYSLATTRSAMAHRLAIVATSRNELRAQCEGAAQGKTPSGAVRSTVSASGSKLVFLFTGQGAQSLGMGRGLHAAWPAFRRAFDRCVGLFDSQLPRTLREVMWADAGSAEAALLDQTGYTQPALFTLEYALAELWRSWGVTPDIAAGHSVGELTAACMAGVFSLEDAVRLCAARGRLMQALPPGGAMVSIAASEAEVAAAVASYSQRVSIAAVNSPLQTVISGEQAAVAAIATAFAERGVRTKALQVSCAFHSPLIEPMLAAFRQIAESIRYQQPILAMVSNLSGKLCTEDVCTSEYWVRHVRESVRFSDGIRTLHQMGARTFVELGPKATLLGLVSACLPEAELALLPSLHASHGEAESLLEALGGVWTHGVSVDWKQLFPAGARRVDLPTYPWQRQRYWVENPSLCAGPVPSLPPVEPEHPASPASAAAPPSREETEVRAWLRKIVLRTVAEVLGFADPGAVDARRGFAEMGMDSLLAIRLRNRLQKELGWTLSATLTFDFPTVDRLVMHLLTQVLPAQARLSETKLPQGAMDEPIAVIGAACRLPGGAEDLEAYWRLLSTGTVVSSEVSASRWKIADWYDPDPQVAGRTYVAKGGFLSEVESFDASFFRISPREAISLDPQQRLLLEVSWEALEHSGQDPAVLRESPTGVFVGVGASEYYERLLGVPDESAWLYAQTGNLQSLMAGRLSYFLGLNGPSLSANTACSSSLVALHLGCQSLRQGECKTALVGGVNVLLSPESFVMLSRMRALSPDGRCKSFAANADGYARSEGCAVVVLKRLRDAQRDGDRILGVIVGTAINHDGASSGLTVPNGPAQQAVLQTALLQARVSPAEVDYVECHGTGTALGDPIEVQALGSVYGQGRPAEHPLLLGSAKAVIGHLEPAAGLAGLLKVLLALRNEQIPAQPELGELNPHIPWSELPVTVVREPKPWIRGERARRAGVSSFGISGTNAHVVLEEAPVQELPSPSPERSAELLVISVKSEAALSVQAARLREHLQQHPEYSLGDVAYSLATTRSGMEYRLAVVATSQMGLQAQLEAVTSGQTPSFVSKGRAAASGAPKVVFVFPGQGSQWLGMGRSLLAQEPQFREVLSDCDRLIQAEAGFSVVQELLADDENSQLARIDVVQPVLFAMGVALAALWRSWGMEPDAILGHSMGEVAAAHVAGILTLEDAVAIICRRSRLLRRISGQGEMALVELSLADVAQALLGYEDRLSVAVSNSPLSTVIAGQPQALEAVLDRLEQRGVFCRRVKVDVASHSPQVEPLREELHAALSSLQPKESQLLMYSTVRNAEVHGPELGAEYWVDNLRQPVRFAEAVQALMESGHGLFVEMSPHPILVPSVEEIRQKGLREGVTVGSLRRGQEERATLLAALGTLWCHGHPVDWQRLYAQRGRRVELPTYPWQRQRYWVDARGAASRGGESTGHPLLGVRVPAAGMGTLFESHLEIGNQSWLGDHRVADQVFFPGAGIAELMRAAAAHQAMDSPRIAGLLLQAPLVLSKTSPKRVQVVVSESPSEGKAVAVYSQPADSHAADPWTLHATAQIEKETTAPTSTLDLVALQARCVQELDVGWVYARLSEVGLVYGPAFQGLRSLRKGQHEALAEVALPADLDVEGYGLHPALLDAAFHAAVAGLESEEAQDPWLPFEMERFTVHQVGAASAWVHVQAVKSREQTPAAIDVHLADTSGNVVAEVRGLRLRRAERRALEQSSGKTAPDSFYRLVWRESSLGELPARSPEGASLVVAGEDSHGARVLAARLGAVLVKPSDLGAALERVSSTVNVVCLWEADADESPAATAQRVATQGLAVVQTLVGRYSTRLYWVTSFAVSVQENEPVAAGTSTIWGLGRSVMHEHPELRCTLLDLDHLPEQVECVLQEMSAGSDEDQVAWRAGQRYIARLVHAEAAPLEKPSFSLEGTVLITGGLGALGLHLARWFARQGVKHLLLTSRRGMATPGAIAAVAELQALGARVTVAAVDVANREAVLAVLAENPVELPLRGVVHTAGILDDGVLTGQTAKRFEGVLRPKVHGAWHLHELTAGQELDFFVLFSSTAGMLGAAGQSNYAAANSFLDALAAYRRAQGLPGQSLGWGAWSDVGLAAGLDAVQQARLSRQGLKWLSPAEGLALFARALARPEAHLGVVPLDMRVLSRDFGPQIPPLWRALLRMPSLRAASHIKGAWAARIAMLQPERREQEVLSTIQADVARLLSLGTATAVPPDRAFSELGMDSLMAVELRNLLQLRLGKPLSATLAFDFPTVQALSKALLDLHLSSHPPKTLPTSHLSPLPADEPIAIVGIGCRYPGGISDPEAFWHLLVHGHDAVSEMPKDRWDTDSLYDPSPEAPGKMVTRCGGFLLDIDKFDAAFFGISPREAEKMDPQQRLLLETSYEALQRAGIPPESLSGTDTGVFVGLMYHDYQALSPSLASLDGYVSTGAAGSVASGRISYLLGLQGPSLTVDTACSSSLVTVHLACQALRQGECALALAGGVTLMLSPAVFVEFSRLRGLAPDGRCKSFSAQADGAGWSEGCGMLVLKRLTDALRDGDPVLALIRGSAVNQDGRSNGLTAPNGPAQQALIRRALAQAAVDPQELGYVECHGTGTTLGDPIEAQALGAAVHPSGQVRQPVVIGSVKSNLGHTQAAAGAAGIIKVVLALQHQLIPKSLHAETLNPHIAFAELGLQVAQQAQPWPAGKQRRIAGVSSFGISGTNAHVVLEAAPALPHRPVPQSRAGQLVLLSAKSEAALNQLAERLRLHLDQHPELTLAEVAHSLATTRSPLEHRVAIVARSLRALQGLLQQVAAGRTPPGVCRGQAPAGAVPKGVFVFPGQGSQWLGMGRTLLAQEPVFAQAVGECDRAIAKEAGFSVLAELHAEPKDSQLERIDIVQPVLFALGVGLAALWRSWGVEPDAVVGHSMGEVGAAYEAGVLSLQDAAAIICRRSRLLRRISGAGEMAMVELSEPETQQALEGYQDRLSVAVSNGPRSTVIAGDPAALAEVLLSLEQRGVFCRRVKVDVASHSPQVEPLRAELLSSLEDITPHRAKLRMQSTVTCEPVQGPELGGAYWAENLRKPVRFAQSVKNLQQSGYGFYIELSAHPVLVPTLQELKGERHSGVAVGSLKRAQDEQESLQESLGALWVSGYPVQWKRQYPAQMRRVELPTYPWQRQRHWVAPKETATRQGEPTGHPLLGVRVPAASGSVFEASVGIGSQPWLADHRVGGQVLVPGAGIAEWLRAAAVAHEGPGVPHVVDLVIQAPLLLPEQGSRRVQVMVQEGSESSKPVALYSQAEDSPVGAAWTQHATGSLHYAEAASRVTLDLPALRIRCTQAQDISALYEALAERGYGYGAAFLGLRSLWLGTTEALSEVALSTGLDAQAYGLHPALLDAAFHTLAAMVKWEDGGALWLPFSMGQFAVYKAGAESAWVHVELPRGDAETVRTAHIKLADASGALIAEVANLQLKRVDAEALQQSDEKRVRDSFYRISWQESAADKSAVTQADEVWVIVAAAGSKTAAALASRLPGSVRVDLAELAAQTSSLASAASAFQVVCLFEEGSGESPVAAALRVATEGLAVVQSLAGQAPKRLWWVTKSALAVRENEPVTVGTGVIWGLGRGVIKEQPELHCTLIDLDAGAESSDSLLRELLERNGDEENQIAWRAGKRYVARLVRAPESPPAGRTFSSAETVLITGGLGALGLEIARWIAQQGVGHLLLTGRRGIDTPGAAAVVAELQAQGTRVTVSAVDVADRVALQTVLQAIPAELPLRGVVHAAVVLDDGVLSEQTAERFALVFRPKVIGAWNLHELLTGHSLDFFVMFSSAASLLGSAGQSNYAAANAFLDSLAMYRQALGLAGQSLSWGAWAEVGLAAALGAKQQARLHQQGMKWLSKEEGISLFQRALCRSEPHLGVMQLDLGAASRAQGALVEPLWRALLRRTALRGKGSVMESWATRLANLQPELREQEVRTAVQTDVAKALGLGDGSSVPSDRAFSELGMDSLMAVELRNLLQLRLGKPLSATLAFDFPTVQALSQWLLNQLLSSHPPKSLPLSALPPLPRDEPIAIVGIGCRYPGGISDPESFWRLLVQGRDAISLIPKDRWDIDSLYDPDPDAPGKMVTRWGGFLSDIDLFDAGFFAISPREAEKMDPQQRLLLETSYEALQRAGIPPESLSGTDTGVFVGLMYHDYQALSTSLESLDGYVSTGAAGSVASGRISYLLGLQGPSLTVDTACSSSLVTVHLACQALRQGECDVALAGGVTLMLSPAVFVEFSRLRGLASDGRSKSFSARADGAGWSEGCGMLVLKRLTDAQRQGDPVLALIRGSAVNQDGRSNGLTAPNGPAQQALIRRALSQAAVQPHEVGYVECHGTGTTLGDPIEAQALGAALHSAGSQHQPVLIGSVKSNLGHTQAAAGVAGIIKSVLALQHQLIPKSLHAETLNPHIAWAELGLQVAQVEQPWPAGKQRRIAGVSSFGISGTNAHVVLEAAPPLPHTPLPASPAGRLVLLSAKSEAALNQLAERLRLHLDAHPELTLAEVAYSLATSRSPLEHRAAIMARSVEHLQGLLEAVAAAKTPPGVCRGQAPAGGGQNVVFVFPGQGSQWLGMGRTLLAQQPVFEQAVRQCDQAIFKEAGFSVLAELHAEQKDSQLERIDIVQPVLFALGVGLAALWRSWGVTPDAVVGHSMGEVGAAYEAGVLGLKDAVAIICRRSRLLRRISGAGQMAMVELSESDTQQALAGYQDRLSLAVSNGPRSTVIAGAPAALDEVLSTLEQRGVFCRRVKVDVASHSPQVEPVLAELLSSLADIAPQRASLRMQSTVTCEPVQGPELDGAYWAANLRKPVRFAQSVKRLKESGYRFYIELSAHPVLVTELEQLQEERDSGVAVGSLRRAQDEQESLQQSLGALWASGYPVQWKRQYPAQMRRVELPTYPWQRQRYWVTPENKPPRSPSYWYELSWREAQPALSDALPRRWILLADRHGAASGLAEALRGQGESCELLSPEDPHRLADFLAIDDLPVCVISLTALDLPTAQQGDFAEASALPLCASLLGLLSQLERRAGSRLFVLTRCAQPIGALHPSPVQACLWGLGRVIALEHPEAWGGIVDIDETSAVESAAVISALRSKGAEDQWVIRDGRLWVPRLVPSTSPAPMRQVAIRPDRAYLITGGLGGLGLESARLLARRGAKYILLTSRSGLPPQELWDSEKDPIMKGRIDAVRALRASGVYVEICAVDVSDMQAMAALCNGMPRPLGGIIHAAGVGGKTPLLDSGSLSSLQTAFSAKVRGTSVLHQLTESLSLDFFVLFSSAAAILGGAGQGHYAAANHFMDVLAHARRAAGLPALSLNLGAVRAGMLSPEVELYFDRQGQRAISPGDAMRLLEEALSGGGVQHLVAHIDWSVFKPLFQARRTRALLDEIDEPTMLARPMVEAAPPPSEAPRILSWLTDLRAALPHERRTMLYRLVTAEAAAVLHIEPETVSIENPLTHYGLDSLTSIELRNRFVARLEHQIPIRDLWSAERLLKHLSQILAELGGETPIPPEVDDAHFDAGADRSGRWVVIPRPVPNAKLRLFCFPYAGGGTPIFARWPSELADFIELCLIAPPGRHARSAEAMPESMEGLVSALLPALMRFLDRPFAFFGHCFGAIVMYEITQELIRQGMRPLHLFVSGAPAPARYMIPDVTRQGPAEILDVLRYIGFASPDLLSQPNLVQEFLSPVIADFRLAASYRYTPEPALSVPITTFAATDDLFAMPSLVEEWQRETTARFSKTVYSGDHYFIEPERASILRIIDQELRNHRHVLASASARQERLRKLAPAPRARFRLVCFPGMLTDTSAYDGWPAALGEQIEVWAVALPGRRADDTDAPLQRIEAMVDWIWPSLIPLLDLPFAFVGHNMGALLSFEVTRRLRRERHPMPAHLIVCAGMAPHAFHFPALQYLPSKRLLEALRVFKVLGNADVLEQTARADCDAASMYRFKPEDALPVPISAFIGDRDTFVPLAGLRAWKTQTSQSFSCHLISGEHNIVGGQSPLVLPHIRRLLDEGLGSLSPR